MPEESQVSGDRLQAPAGGLTTACNLQFGACCPTALRAERIVVVQYGLARGVAVGGSMPIYTYECTVCGKRFERLRPMTSAAEDTPPPCPACASTATRRIVSTFAVHGPAGPDHQEIAADRAQAQRTASITSRETIDKLRSTKRP